MITDVDYADDLALTSDIIEDAEKLLHSLESAAKQIGLHINAKKTEFMCYHQAGQIKSLNGHDIKHVDHFTYLGSNIQSTEKDIQIRKAKAWAALNKLQKIWKPDLSKQLKRHFFKAVVESVLLYGSTTWTLTKQQEQRLDGCYTRMLRAALNIDWRKHPTKAQLYGSLPPVSAKLREQRLRFAGHCFRSKGELVSDLLLWEPSHCKRSVGAQARTYTKKLQDDTGLHPDDLPTAMNDRMYWRSLVDSVRGEASNR